MENQHAQDLVAGGLLSVREAAAFLRISVAGLYGFMERGELPYAKLGRSRRIPRQALVAFAASRMVGTSQAEGS